MILVYQAYGRNDVIQQSIFSIVSLFAQIKTTSSIQVWVYTDQAERFAKYFAGFIGGEAPRLKILTVNSDAIQKWRGEIQFVHRVKIEMLIDAGKQFNGPLFYVDGDTYFKESPESIFMQVNDQVSLMHIAENKVSDGRDPLSKKICKFLKKNEFHVEGQAVKIAPEIVMWNAGVIGISHNNKALLHDILHLTDVLYKQYPKHIMEQLAVSFYLQKNTNVLPTDSVIGHYWDQKDDYQIRIEQFLTQYFDAQKACQNFHKFSHPIAITTRPTDERIHLTARLKSNVQQIFNFFVK